MSGPRSLPDSPHHLGNPMTDPEILLNHWMTVMVLAGAVLIEGLLAITAPTSEVRVWLFHGSLTVVAVGLLILTRGRFRPWLFAPGIVALAWCSSSISGLFGPSPGLLVWHVFLPTAVLLLVGTPVGLVIFGFDLAVAIVQQLWWTSVGGAVVSSSVLGGEIAAGFLFVLFFFFLRAVRSVVAAHRAETGETLHLLSQTKDSEARWADQVMFLETLMDVIPFPLFHKGMDGRYITANASFRVVFDVQKEAVTGQKNDAFLRPENAKALAKIELDVLARDSMAVEETVLIHADGQPHSFIVYLVPFVDGAQASHGSIGVLIDITERKAREGKLVQLNATKDQLFSIISHDLRGPVGKLKQLLDIYIDDPGIFNKATWDQVFHDMRRSADSLFQLLENLLSWARAQQGNEDIHYEAIPLEPLVADVFSVLKLLASDKKISLEMNLQQLNGPLLTDRHTLSTILRNLVHNALKFTMPGGTITVTAHETVADLWIEVRDTGVGMSEDAQKKIFINHERLTSYGTGKERGQGIGLGLCQDLAASLGAHLEVESQVGVGTKIRLHLPTPEL